MGLLEMFAPDAVQSPLYQAFDNNRYTLSNMLLGGVGKQGADRLAGMANGVMQTNDMRQKIAMQQQLKQQELNKSLEYLKGANPQLAQMAQAGAPLDTVWGAAMKQSGVLPNDYTDRANAARQYGIDPNTTEGKAFILTGSLPASMTGKGQYGLSPIYGKDANGNPVIMQMSTTGQVGQAQLPPGVSLSKEPIKLDTGDSYTLLDPITRQTIGVIPKNLAGAEQQKEQGKQQGQLISNLPQVEAASNQMLGTIDSILQDPYLPSVTGPIQGRLPNLTGDSQRVQSKIDQLKGQAFLQAYNTLRGGGQITEVEGQKATEAMVRLNQAQNDADFKAALTDLRTIVQGALERARNRAANSYSPTPGMQPQAQPSGATSSGVKWSVD